MKTNFHMHTVWCDGKDTPRAMVESALAKGFSAIGFSSHASFPESVRGATALVELARIHAEEKRVEPVFTDLLAGHSRRMAAIGLDA